MTDKHASTVQILTWFLVVTSILGVGARGLTKAVTVRSVSLDDYLIAVSLVCSSSPLNLCHAPNRKTVFCHWTISRRFRGG